MDLNMVKMNQLVSARYGNQAIRDKIVLAGMALVQKIVLNTTQVRGLDQDDLMMAGVEGLLKSIDGYDDRFGSSFVDYAILKITSEIKSVLKQAQEQKLSASLERQPKRVLNVEDVCEKREQMMRLNVLIKQLDPKDREIIESYFGLTDEKLTIEQIADKLFIPTDEVIGTLVMVLKELKDDLQDSKSAVR